MYSHDHDLIEKDIEGYLAKHQGKELLRFVTVGSVDDGKSTLIGRLLHDTHGIYEDQLSAVKRVSAKRSTEIDFSLFTDGLHPNEAGYRVWRDRLLPFLDEQRAGRPATR